MANWANTNPVARFYRSVIEEVINDVRDIFLDDGVGEQVLMELKALWEEKIVQSRAVDGFHPEEQRLSLQGQQQPHPHHHQPQPQQQRPQPEAPQQARTQQVLIPPARQAAAPAPDSTTLKQPPPPTSASNVSAAATAALLALPAGATPVQHILTSSGQLLRVVRAANGAQYVLQPQQSVVLQPQQQPQQQQEGVPQSQPGGGVLQVLAPLPGGTSAQTAVIIQPQRILLTGSKTQVVPATAAAAPAPAPAAPAPAPAPAAPAPAPAPAAPAPAPAVPAPAPAAPAPAPRPAAGQQQPQAPPTQQRAPLVSQTDGAGDTSSSEEEDGDDDDDEEEEEEEEMEEDREKDGAEGGQVEEAPLNSEDDVSDEEGEGLFDTEHVVVCLYDKIQRNKNRWKFHLQDGIMTLNGKDYIFSKAIGDAEW